MRMKTHSLKKIIIPSFALLIGGSLTASLTSTVAWFQYATRARVAYVDALSHCSKLLKISVDNGLHWGNDYYQDDMVSHISGNQLLPITTGPQTKNTNLTYYQVTNGNTTKNYVNFYSQPDMGRGGDYTSWSVAKNTSYAQFEILVKVNDVDGSAQGPLLENEVYLSSLVINDDFTNGANSDLSDSVRVHMAVTDDDGTRSFLFARGRGNDLTADITTSTSGCLDLNNDGAFDRDFENFGTYAVGDVVTDAAGNYYQCILDVSTPSKTIDTTGTNPHWVAINESFSTEQAYALDNMVIYKNKLYKCNVQAGIPAGEWNSENWTEVVYSPFYCIYGTKGSTQVAYSNSNPDLIVPDPNNPVANTNPTSIGKTGANNMKIVVTTWIEGWTKLDKGLNNNANGSSDTEIWDPTQYINKKFNVGIRLEVKSHDSDHNPNN